MKRIFKGLYEILSSNNEAEFVQESQAFDCLHDIFIGMDGFIGEAPRGVGHRKFFVQIWRKILDNSNLNKHPAANSNKKIVDAIYDLRCELAHGTNSSVNQRVEKLKKMLGDNYNKGSYDAKSLGFSLNLFLKYVFNSIIDNSSFYDNLVEYKMSLLKPRMIDKAKDAILSLFR